MFTCAIQADNPDGPVVAQTNRVVLGIVKAGKACHKNRDLNFILNCDFKVRMHSREYVCKNVTFPSQKTRTEGK